MSLHNVFFFANYIQNIDNLPLRADGGELHVKGFEEDVACIADPDVVRQIHQEHGPSNQEREDPQDQLPPHRPLQSGVARNNCGCGS